MPGRTAPATAVSFIRGPRFWTIRRERAMRSRCGARRRAEHGNVRWPRAAEPAHASHFDVVEQHGDLAEGASHLHFDGIRISRRGGDRRGRRRWKRRRGTSRVPWRGRRSRDGRSGLGCPFSRRPGSRHRRTRCRHVHEVLDALADLRRHDLHSLGEFAGQHLGLVLRSHLQRAQVAGVGVERDGRQRHDREEEERNDEAETQTHSARRRPIY